MTLPTPGRTALLASASGLALLLAGPAQAACTASAGTGAAPAPGATVTCTGPLETTATNAPGAGNVTVNVNRGSGYSVTGMNAITLGGLGTLTVSPGGGVTTSGDNARGVSFTNGATVSVLSDPNGTGSISTQGENAGAIFTGPNANVSIGGTVRTGGSMANAVEVGPNSVVNVNQGGLATTSSGMSNAITSAGDAVRVNVNQGGTVTTSSSMSNPILLSGANGAVSVGGEVRSSAGNSDAVKLTGANGQVTVTSTGFVNASSSGSDLISATGPRSTVDVQAGGRRLAASSGAASAVRVGDQGTVNISREVAATSSNATAVTAGNNAAVNVRSGGSIVASSSQSTGVQLNSTMAGSMSTVTVERNATIDARGGQAIVAIGPGSTMVQVDGTVNGQSGATAVQLGGGNDTFTVSSTGTFGAPGNGPLLNGGGGQNTVNLANPMAYDTSRFVNVQQINSTGPGNTVNVTSNQPGQNVGASNGGTANVNGGGSAGSVNAGNGGTVNVNGGGNGGNATANGGGTINVNQGGQAGTTTANNGGTVNLNQGGSAGATTANSGGRVNLNGGQSSALTTNSGSTVGSRASRDIGQTSQRFAGANFGPGTTVALDNPDFFTGSAAGDTITQTLRPNAFTSRAQGRNAVAVAVALETLAARRGGTNPAPVNAVLNSTGLGANGVFGGLSGEVYSQALYGGLLAGGVFSDLLQNRGALTAPLGGGALAAPARPLAALGYAPDRAPRFTKGGALPASFAATTPAPAARGIWASGVARTTSIDGGRGDRNGFDATSYGVAIGAEGEFALGGGSGIAGIAAGYTRTDISPDRRLATASLDSAHFGAYAAGTSGPLAFSGAATYAYQSYDVSRSLAAAGGASSARSRPDGHLFAGNLEASYAIYRLPVSGGAFTFAPTAALEGAYAERGRSAETGAPALGLLLGSASIGQVVPGVGVTVGTSFLLGTITMQARAQVLYEHVFGDRAVSGLASFNGSGVPFAIASPSVDRDRVAVKTGVAFDITPTISAYTRYEGRFSGNVGSHGGSVGLTARF